MGFMLRFTLGLAIVLLCILPEPSSSWERPVRSTTNLTENLPPKETDSNSTTLKNYIESADKIKAEITTSQPAHNNNLQTDHDVSTSVDSKVKINKAVNRNDLFTTESTRFHSKSVRHDSYDPDEEYEKHIKDDNIAIESEQQETKAENKSEKDVDDFDFKPSTYTSGRSIEFDFDKHSSPNFKNKNNVYIISASPDSESDKYRIGHEFEEKFKSYKEPSDFSSYFGSTPDYLKSHDDFFDKIHHHHEDDDDFEPKHSDTEISETKEKSTLDFGNFDKHLEAHFPEPKRPTPDDFDLDVDKMREKDNDTKVDLDFLKFKRLEKDDKKDKTGISKNVVSEKRTSLAYDSSFNKTEILGDKDDNQPDDQRTASDARETTINNRPPEKVESTTYRNIIFHQTTKKNAILTKPPVANNSHISLLNNKIESEKIKTVATTTPGKRLVHESTKGDTEIPKILQTTATTITSETTTLRKSPSTIGTEGQTEVAPGTYQQNGPINVSKRGSVKFTVHTTEANPRINRFRSSYVSNKLETTTQRPTRIRTRSRSTTTEQNIPEIKVQPLSSDISKSVLLPTSETVNLTTEGTTEEPTTPEKLLTVVTSTTASTTVEPPTTTFTTTTKRAQSRRIIRPITRRLTGNTSILSTTTEAITTTKEPNEDVTTSTTVIPDVSTVTSLPVSNKTSSPNSQITENSTGAATEETSLPPVTTSYSSTETIYSSTETIYEETEKPLSEYDDVSYSSEVSYSSSSGTGSTPPTDTNAKYTVGGGNETTIHIKTEVNNSYISVQDDDGDTSTALPPSSTVNVVTETGVKLVIKVETTTPRANSTASSQGANDNGPAASATDESSIDDYGDDDEDSEHSTTPSPEEKVKAVEIHPDVNANEGHGIYSYTTSSFGGNENSIETTTNSELQTPKDDDNSGTIAAITISCVGGVCLILLAGLLIIMRKRQKRFNYGQRCTPVSLDAYSMDNVSVYNSVRRKGIRSSKRSFGNPAFEDPSSVAHPLNFPAVAKFATNFEDMAAEFEEIPQVTARTTELPEGCETKNRYANVIPLPETRVYLGPIDGFPNSDYINANYVTGPKGIRGYYIACQAPLQNTVDDFWRMIWEQQSKVVLMLTHLYENGVEKCADYLPPSEVTDCHRLFGDFQVTLKKREVKDKYVISTLQLKNMVSNSWREVTHLWYLGWPERGVPSEANSLIAFLIEARSYIKNPTHTEEIKPNRRMPRNPEISPVVVHCSPGTGRTGTVIACDIAIREFELTRQVDVPKIVYRIRRDRASSVQTKDQYFFIYKVISLYATKLTGGAFDSI